MARKKRKPQTQSAYLRLKLSRQRRKQLRYGRIVALSLACIILLIVLLPDRLKDESHPPEATLSNTQNLPPLSFGNAVEERAVRELRGFGQWLADNRADGFIGEIGWPDRPADGELWNRVADQWYKEAAYHNFWVTAWAAGSWWGDYQLAVYTHAAGDRNLDVARAQAGIFEKYPTNGEFLRGVNVAGMEFGAEKPGFSNSKPGMAGTDYFYESAESMAYLAKRGVRLIRLPLRWERIQPDLGKALKTTEINAINRLLDAAAKNNIKVVLDLHNYGVYKTGSGELSLGTSLPHDRLEDVWLRLSGAFKHHPALAGYGLMNEPHDLPAGSYGTSAKNWEAASQRVLAVLRNSSDTTMVMVAGYDWSSLARWSNSHPKGWIQDPANNFRYEAHHYWDRDGSGEYPFSFQQELADH